MDTTNENDSSDQDEDYDRSTTSSFHISVTFGNSKNNSLVQGPSASPLTKSGSFYGQPSSRQKNVEHCYHSPFAGQNETKHCSRHQHQLQTTIIGETLGNTRNIIRSKSKSNKTNTTTESSGGKSFRFVEPHPNHKSALFVNLSTTKNSIEGGNHHNLKREQQQLFISPDLNLSYDTSSTLKSPYSSSSSSSSGSPIGTTRAATSPPDSVLTSDSSSYELLGSDNDSLSFCGPIQNSDGAMSHSCNFINWMSVGRTSRRASSATPTSSSTNSTTTTTTTSSIASKDLTTSTTGGGNDTRAGATSAASQQHAARRASSSEGLNNNNSNQQDRQGSLLGARSSSGNHLAISDSVETICETDQTQTNSFSSRCNQLPVANVAPLQIENDSPTPFDDDLDELKPVLSVCYPAMDLEEELKLEQECLALEEEANYWERQVEELERKQYDSGVSRQLVERIIEGRRELRELELQLLEMNFNENEFWDNLGASRNQSHHNQHRSAPSTDLKILEKKYKPTGAASKFGSHLKPGQENTADILNVVPPSGSLQHRQYLNKASSGTDTSDYSQLPRFVDQQHSHRLGAGPFLDGSAFRGSNHQDCKHHSRHRHQRHLHHHQQIYQHTSSSSQRVSRRQENHQQSIYMQLDGGGACGEKLRGPNNRSCSSPIRPNHFKDEFKPPKAVIVQDSSSTASSSTSPQ